MPRRLRPAALAWIAANPQAQQPWDDKNYKMPGGTPANPKIAGMLSVAPAVLKQKTRGLYPAPEYALAAMVEGAQVDFDTALRIESRYFVKTLMTPEASNWLVSHAKPPASTGRSVFRVVRVVEPQSSRLKESPRVGVKPLMKVARMPPVPNAPS